MSNNFWMHNRKFLVNSRKELTQIWNVFTGRELMNATDTLIFLHLTNHLEKESSKDLIESVCHVIGRLSVNP